MNDAQADPGDHLRFSSAVLRLLGEELNPNPNQGIVELVKNSYDADASWCRIQLKREHLPGGTIIIRDDGVGMTLNEIRLGWLIVGESKKRTTGYTARKNRLLVGSKGLGRLAALRLGRRATLTTRPLDEPLVEHRLVLDWEAFDRSVAVDDVVLRIETLPRQLGASHGTEIEIVGLLAEWNPVAVRKLARTLLLLSDPFSSKDEKTSTDPFQVTLESEVFAEIIREAAADYWTHFDYHLESGVNESGKGWAVVRDVSGKSIFEASHEDIAPKNRPYYRVPELKFELWEFKLKTKKFATQTISKTDLGKWISEFGGVHLYYRQVRVSPYGDPGNDWLDINLGRASSPEERPSTNNSIGRIRIDDPEALLIQKTDRQGFLENVPFTDLREFAGDVIDWMQRVRIKKRDAHKRAEKMVVVELEKETRAFLEQEVQKLPEAERAPVAQAVESHLKAVSETIDFLQMENELYHTLGTIGTTAAAFAHQSEKPLEIIDQESHTLEYLLGDPSNPAFPIVSLGSVIGIRNAAQALHAFSAVTLRLLEHEKRRKGRQQLHELILDMSELLEPYLVSREASIVTDFRTDSPVVWGSRAAIESIFTNLIINSLRAFARDYGNQNSEEDATGERKILIRTEKLGDRVRVIFSDSGPGIRELALDDIWIAGRTTTPKGSGLGLCIVRDTVEDMGGVISAHAHGELGGAEFVIELPTRT